MSVKIFGYGYVGKVMHKLFPDALIHDPPQGMFSEKVADIGIVCVPTNNLPDGSLDMSIVEDVIKNSKEEVFIMRSATMPGTADRLEKKYKVGIVTDPEHLGEGIAHPFVDESERKFKILGGRPEVRKKVIDLYFTVYNANIALKLVTNLEAEVIKLSENRAIMFKVAECQELYDACEAAGVDYYTVRDAVYGDDPRFTRWHTAVYPHKRGAQSHCIPKDPKGWAAWAADSELTDALIKYNDRLVNG